MEYPRMTIANRAATAVAVAKQPDAGAGRSAAPESVMEALVARLLEVGSECEFPANHVMIEVGLPGSGLFLIREGTVRVEAPERTVELRGGDVVGDWALDSPDGLRTARVICITDVRAVAVDRAAYDAAVEEVAAAALAALPVASHDAAPRPAASVRRP